MSKASLLGEVTATTFAREGPERAAALLHLDDILVLSHMALRQARTDTVVLDSRPNSGFVT